MKRICVFCGSSPGARSEYVGAARGLGQLLANKKIGVVYGGASVGLMGQLAKACLEAGGEVTGVITKELVNREVANMQLNQLSVVENMQTRIAMMAELADGFIALPGGLGTLEELFEVLTWAQLGMHRKPTGLLNVCGYYDPLMALLEQAEKEQFIEPEHLRMVQIDEDAGRLLEKFERYQAPENDKAAWAIHLSKQAGSE